MKIDGGLRPMFRERLPAWHWTSIETMTVNGVPDAEFAFDGAQGWNEYKFTHGYSVTLRPEQIGWHLRRARAGCSSFIVVRRTTSIGKEPGDELYIFRGADAAALRDRGLGAGGPAPLARFAGGPARWDWNRVSEVLLSRAARPAPAGEKRTRKEA